MLPVFIGIQPCRFFLLKCINVLFSLMKNVIKNVSADSRCEVHQTILGIREGKEGWFHLYCPGGIACDDEGEIYGTMVIC